MLTFTMNARFAVNVVWEWSFAFEDSGSSVAIER